MTYVLFVTDLFMTYLFSVQAKQIELHLTTAEALVYAAMGVTSPAARDVWTQTEADYQVSK